MAKNKIQLVVALGHPRSMPTAKQVATWAEEVYGTVVDEGANVAPTRRTVRFEFPLPEEE